LTEGEFAARRTSFFPSLKATLNHIVTVDWFYVDALERSLGGPVVNNDAARFFEPEEPFAAIEPLREAQRAVDRRLVEVCRGLTEATLDIPVGVFRRSGVQYETVTRLLEHLFQHQIHHRGQVHAMLAGTRVAPPQLDEFFCANEAHLRAPDFAALGFSEEMIWAPVDSGAS
jgi:uncharacterized damage-inducible protein DinB